MTEPLTDEEIYRGVAHRGIRCCNCRTLVLVTVDDSVGQQVVRSVADAGMRGQLSVVSIEDQCEALKEWRDTDMLSPEAIEDVRDAYAAYKESTK